MRSGIRRTFDDLYEKTETTYRVMQARRDARRTVRQMGPLSPELREAYRNEIVPYWAQYQQKPPAYWFRLFSQDGVSTDPRYIPEDLWFGAILPYYSNMFFRRPYEDKGMHHILFPDLRRPRTIVKSMAGQFYTDRLERLTAEEAIRLCKQEKSWIIKPSIDSGTGRGIQFYDSRANQPEDIERMFADLGTNFVVQEIVEQHPVLSSLHAASLNTIRVLSFFFRGEVYILSVIVRMGAGESRIDNISSGGMQCGVDPITGQLSALACTKKRDWVGKSPDGTVFAGLRVPSYEKIVETVRNEHARLPHFRLIGWDFSVAPDGEPVFIEYNVCPGANQMTCGPTFGEQTEAALEDVFVKRELAASQN